MSSSDVMTWWREQYAPLVAQARAGGPTAFHITLVWATAEVEYADAHHTEPVIGVPAHF